MNYEFPVIRNISDVLPAIEGRDEFVVADKGLYTVINYNVMMTDTFPDVIVDADMYDQTSGVYVQFDYSAAIRRECRGITFCSKTGDIIRRPFHKFFNVNEREETQSDQIDLSTQHVILDKLDGSMIAPVIVTTDNYITKMGGGYYEKKLIWGTKMVAQDFHELVEQFVSRNYEYADFAEESIRNGWTPIFEWCSRKKRIVLDYFDDQLVLTAMRNIHTGEYALHDNLKTMGLAYTIPVVDAFGSQTDIKSFVNHVRDLEDIEGYVIRFDDGHMIKLKCNWYVQIHKAKEAILQDRNIVELILEEHLDDVKSHLPAEDRDRLTQFESDFNAAVKNVYNNVINTLYGLLALGMDRKTFALEHAPSFDSYIRPILFKNFDFVPTQENTDKIMSDVKNMIRNNLGRTVKYEAIRDAWFPRIQYNV